MYVWFGILLKVYIVGIFCVGVIKKNYLENDCFNGSLMIFLIFGEWKFLLLEVELLELYWYCVWLKKMLMLCWLIIGEMNVLLWLVVFWICLYLDECILVGVWRNFFWKLDFFIVIIVWKYGMIWLFDVCFLVNRNMIFGLKSNCCLFFLIIWSCWMILMRIMNGKLIFLVLERWSRLVGLILCCGLIWYFIWFGCVVRYGRMILIIFVWIC